MTHLVECSGTVFSGQFTQQESGGCALEEVMLLLSFIIIAHIAPGCLPAFTADSWCLKISNQETASTTLAIGTAHTDCIVVQCFFGTVFIDA